MQGLDNRKKVVVGLSGGVDSSVAAALLVEQGYAVVGLFMKNWDEQAYEDSECNAAEDFRDVVSVCGKLGIKYYTVNFADRYKREVFDYFLDTLKKGNTPNPDVLCNRRVKFGAFYDFAIEELGADFVATGHYAGISGKNLIRAKDSSKDQTYFLNQVPTHKFEKVIFPLADMTKSQVRQKAKELGLNTADKKDSTGICFIGERDFGQFVYGFIPQKHGDIVDMSGKVVGKHKGLHGYTIGQRRGLGIGGIKGGEGSWFVVKKDMANNHLIVHQADQSVLNSNSCDIATPNIIGDNTWQRGSTHKCTAKFRYRQIDVGVRVRLYDDHAFVEFDSPQRAVTVGQYAVFYDKDRCLGGGEIVRVYGQQ